MSPQEQPTAETAAHRERPMMGQEGWESCTHGDCVEQHAPERWAPQYGVVLGQCLERHSLWEGQAGSVHEGLYPMGGTSCWSRERVEGERSSREQVLWTLYCATGRGKGKRVRSQVESGKKWGR